MEEELFCIVVTDKAQSLETPAQVLNLEPITSPNGDFMCAEARPVLVSVLATLAVITVTHMTFGNFS